MFINNIKKKKKEKNFVVMAHITWQCAYDSNTVLVFKFQARQITITVRYTTAFFEHELLFPFLKNLDLPVTLNL